MSTPTPADTTPARTCRRGHLVQGNNAIGRTGHRRCRACKRATDQIYNSPDTMSKDDMGWLSDEKYRDILAGRTTTPRPARKKAAPKKTTAAPKKPEPVHVNEAQRRMPHGIKQYLRTVGPTTEALEDAPAGALEWLQRYELTKTGRRGNTKTGPVTLNDRGRRVARSLRALLAGQG